MRKLSIPVIAATIMISSCASNQPVNNNSAVKTYSYATYYIRSNHIELNEVFNDINTYLKDHSTKSNIKTSLAPYPLPLVPPKFKEVYSGFWMSGFPINSTGSSEAHCDDAIMKAQYSVNKKPTLMCVFAYKNGYSVDFISSSKDIDFAKSTSSSTVYGSQLISEKLTTTSVSYHLLGLITSYLGRQAYVIDAFPQKNKPNKLI